MPKYVINYGYKFEPFFYGGDDYFNRLKMFCFGSDVAAAAFNLDVSPGYISTPVNATVNDNYVITAP